MKNRIVPMIGIAAVFGAISIFAANFWIKSQANARVETTVAIPARPEVKFKTIVVAKSPLRFGMKLERTALAEIPWAENALPKGAFGTVDELLKDGERVVLSPIDANEPVLLAELSGPNGRATLSNLLTPGMRAVTIKTDEIAGVGGFVTPGDRVDVVLTRNAGDIEEVKKNATGASGSNIATEVVIEAAKVLSVGQAADERATTPKVADSVTLEVTPEGAQKIALARNIGKLSLSLRSARQAGDEASGMTTISAFGGSVASKVAAGAGDVVSAIPHDEGEKKFTTVVVTRGIKPETYKVNRGGGVDGGDDDPYAGEGAKPGE
ncbi:MAG: Flp pilus assembly protein CpaB [Rhizobiaceae bacterium]